MRAAILALGAALLAGAALAAPEDRLVRDVRTLSADDMQGRAVGEPGGAKARRYLVSRMTQIGLEPLYPDYAQPFSAASRGKVRNGVNLVGRLRGTGGGDKVLMVTAHYDHVGLKDGQIHNGADDNASGVAAVLAIAEAFKRQPPKHDVVFVLWDGEESGLVGSRWFVRAPPFALSKVGLVMNFDMVARGDKGELYVAGAHHYPFLRPRLEGLAKGAPITLKLGHDGPPWTGSDDWTSSSDHGPFHAAGVPFAYFGVEDHPDYHRPGDDADKIPAPFFRGSVATLISAARMFDRDLAEIAKEAGR
jgi:Zn-dependent M28 family amino/carboxypeptidase